MSIDYLTLAERLDDMAEAAHGMRRERILSLAKAAHDMDRVRDLRRFMDANLYRFPLGDIEWETNELREAVREHLADAATCRWPAMEIA